MRSTYLLGFVLLAGSNLILAAAEPDLAKLAAGLSAGSAAEQQAAADALADLGAAAGPAVPQLLTALESKDVDLRWRAARALGMIGDAKSLDALRKHAADTNAGVRAQSIFAIARLRAEDQASLAAVIARLTDPDPAVRRATVTGLRMLKADRTKVIPLVVKALEDA
ncbi:MAG: HEAT repeat domain-containing protein, partial [Planctomycetaceae bacterium]|nr:HEAT repeat domain-containing protein [Planctomycetaceae bacterium]